jgi:hypothetical protein
VIQESASNKTRRNGIALTSPSACTPALRPHPDTWLYISNVANNVTADVIKSYVSQHLKRENISCHMLLPMGISPQSRRTLSFKLRIPASCTSVALDKSFWPYGVQVRYFTSNEDFTNRRQWT